MISPALTAFLEEGIAIHVGTRNASLVPSGARAIAVKVENGGTHLRVYVPASAWSPLLEDLHANGQGTVLFGRPIDDRSCQVKGTFVDVRPVGEDERALVIGQWEGFVANLALIGIPRKVFSAWTTWPVVAARFKVTALFEQTPGPAAGTPLA